MKTTTGKLKELGKKGVRRFYESQDAEFEMDLDDTMVFRMEDGSIVFVYYEVYELSGEPAKMLPELEKIKPVPFNRKKFEQQMFGYLLGTPSTDKPSIDEISADGVQIFLFNIEEKHANAIVKREVNISSGKRAE